MDAGDARLVDLEIRYTHLEHQLQELNTVVFSQQRMIDGLTRELLQLRRSLDPGETPPAEKPPHY